MAFLSFISRVFGAESAEAPYKVADIYTEMREMVLKLKPADFKNSDNIKVLAVVMDTGYPEAACTLVSTADGSASLYFSNGGGIIGAGEHPDGGKASKGLIEASAGFLKMMKKTKDTPIVVPGMAAFYLVTTDGIFTVSAKEEDFGEDRHPVSSLFHKAHELITAIRVIDERCSKSK
jgi:hypothetical protein